MNLIRVFDMKKLVSSSYCMLCGLILSAIAINITPSFLMAQSQPFNRPWVKAMNVDRVTDIEEDSFGNVFVSAIYTSSFTFQGVDITASDASEGIVIFKLDADGNYLAHFTNDSPRNDGIYDLLSSGTRLYAIGEQDGRFFLWKFDHSLNTVVTLSDPSQGTNTHSRGLRVGYANGYIIFGGMFTSLSSFEIRSTDNPSSNITDSLLTANGPDDFFISRIDTAFSNTGIHIVQAGSQTESELVDNFYLGTNTSQSSGVAYASFASVDSSFVFDSTPYNVSISNDTMAIYYRYNFDTNSILNTYGLYADGDNSPDFIAPKYQYDGIPITIENGVIFDRSVTGIVNNQKTLFTNIDAGISDLEVVGLATNKRLTSLEYHVFFTAKGSGVITAAGAWSINLQPRGDTSVANLYMMKLNSGLQFTDLDNLGEVDGLRTNDRFLVDRSSVQNRQYYFSGSLNTDTDLEFGRDTLAAGNAGVYIGAAPDTYFEFITPMDGDTLKQYSVKTVGYYSIDHDTNRDMRGRDAAELSGEFVINSTTPGNFTILNSGPEIGSLNWNVGAQTPGDYNIFPLYSASVAASDTASITIAAAGLVSTNAVNSSSFGSPLYAKRDYTIDLPVYNTGNELIQVDSVKLLHGDNFSFTGTLDSIQVSQSDTLQLTFSSTVGGNYTDSLIVYSNAGNPIYYGNVQALSLDVNADADFASDSLFANSNPYNPFANSAAQQIGEADTVAFYIFNNGTDSLYLSNITFKEGTHFSLTENGDSSSVILPTPENSLSERIRRFDIIFSPDSWTSFTDTLVIQSNDSLSSRLNSGDYSFQDGLIHIPLQASGTDTLGRIQNTTYTFPGTIYSENDSTGMNVALQNTGVAPLTVNSVSFNRDIYSTNLQLPVDITNGGNQVFALSVETNFINIPQDTTIIDTMTINHTGSSGQSTYLLTLNLTKSRPIIQFAQTDFNNYSYNYANGTVDVSLNSVPIQDFRTERIEFYNVGQDTLTVDGVVVQTGINNTKSDVVDLVMTQGPPILAPGDTGYVSLDYELFLFDPFAFSVQIFTDAERVSYKTSSFSGVSTVDSDNGDFTYTYTGETSVPAKTVVMSELLTDTLHPSFVNILLQATDNNGVGMTFLDQDNPNDVNPDGTGFFSVTENGNTVDPNAAEQDFRIFKQDAIDFEINTALVLDMSTSIPIQDLPKIKEGAKSLVRNLEKSQRMAIYVFSDIVEEKIAFTSDTTALITVIDALQRTGSSTNLFGAVIDAANDLNPLLSSTREKIARGNIVVFTDGVHNANNLTSSNVNSATTNLDVYAVGVGSANTSELQQITRFQGRVFSASDFDALNTEFRKVQREIAKTADSFYILSYISPSRGTPNVPLVVSVDSPLSGSSLNTNFSSAGFSSLFSQVVVNQNFPELLGVDTVFVPANVGEDVFASTILNANTPTYRWETSNSAVVTIQDDDDTDGIATMVPQGTEGQFAQVTVTDTSNVNLAGTEFLSKTFTVVLGAEVEIPVFSLNVIAGQTGTFQLGDTGVELIITQNNGDGFSLTAEIGPDVVGTLPATVDSVFTDEILTINASSSGTVDIVYSIKGDLRDNPNVDISLFTVVKRDNNTSPWADLAADANLTLTIGQDSTITVDGLTTFSQFALALRTQQAVGIEDGYDDGLPDQFTLNQNYPNPFNPETTIRFGLPQTANVRIELYNVIGQRVMIITEGRFAAGWHEVRMDGRGLASGMYIYRLSTPNFSTIKKLTLIK